MEESKTRPISINTLGQIQDHTRALGDAIQSFIESHSTSLVLGQSLPSEAAVELASIRRLCGALHIAVFDALVPSGRIGVPSAHLTAST